MKPNYVAALAKAVQGQKSRQTYGKIRTKLEKQGFSEIAIYKAMVDHCEEKGIPVLKMTKDTFALLEGCANNIAFIKQDDRFKYLSGLTIFHRLRHGNLEKGEAKSPEQRGLFLCNKCYLIKVEADRSVRKNTKHSCKYCVQEEQREASARFHERKKTLALPKDEPQAEPEKPTGIISPEKAVEIIKDKSAQEEVRQIMDKPVEVKEPVVQEVMPKQNRVVITEVMADAEEATVTVKCKTADLPNVLTAMNNF